jgi:hypothetical protein
MWTVHPPTDSAGSWKIVYPGIGNLIVEPCEAKDAENFAIGIAAKLNGLKAEEDQATEESQDLPPGPDPLTLFQPEQEKSLTYAPDLSYPPPGSTGMPSTELDPPEGPPER